MPKYLTDKQYTLDRVAELVDAVEYARYELAAALMTARPLGLSWADLGDRLGMTKQGASQFAKRQMALQTLDDAEHERLCRFLGIGERATRYEVRVIVSGRPGVSAVKRQTVSAGHLHRHVAERVADKRGDGAEVWSIDPDGTATQLRIRPAHRRPVPATARRAAPDAEHVETPF